MFDFNQKIDPAELDLKDTVVSINRVTKVVKGGKNLSFSALVVVGDGHGHVGFGIGKAKEVPVGDQEGHRVGEEGAGARAARRHHAAARHARSLRRRQRAAQAGSGRHRHHRRRRVRAVVEAAGHPEHPHQVPGLDNPHNVVRATFAGLRSLKEAGALVARLRGKELEELVGAGDRA
jgi:small subunit ribosomal protein S5